MSLKQTALTILALVATVSTLFADPPANDAPAAATPKTLYPPSTLTPTKDFDEAAKRVIFRPLPAGLAGNPQAVAFMKNLEDKRKDFLVNIHRITGLVLPEGANVDVIPLEWPPKESPMLYAQTTQVNDRKSARIRVYVSLVLRDGKSFEKIFQHEMTHAVQITWMYGGGIYWAQPNWFMEGLGNFGGEDDIGVISGSRGRPNRVKGLNDPKGNPYLEGGLMFRYIEKTWGANTVKAVIRDVTITHIPALDALKKHTQLDFPTFAANSKKFSVDYLTVASPQNAAPQTPAPVAPVRPAAPNVAETPRPAPVPVNIPAPVSFGWVLQDIDDEGKTSVTVAAVSDESPAAQAGLEAGDVLISLNGQKARNAAEFRAILESVKPRATSVLEISREGKMISLKVAR